MKKESGASLGDVSELHPYYNHTRHNEVTSRGQILRFQQRCMVWCAEDYNVDDKAEVYGDAILMADLIGWVGSIAFAICGIPQAWECFKSRSAKGINPLFVILWLIGEVCYVISVFLKFGWVNWMMFNYFANIFSIAVIIYYLVKDRRNIQRTGSR